MGKRFAQVHKHTSVTKLCRKFQGMIMCRHQEVITTVCAPCAGNKQEDELNAIFTNWSVPVNHLTVKCTLPNLQETNINAKTLRKQRLTIITRGPRTLALCLTAAVGMTLAIFCTLVSKPHCCKLNQLQSGLTPG